MLVCMQYAEHIPRFSKFQNTVNIGGMVGGSNDNKLGLFTVLHKDVIAMYSISVNT